MATIILTPKEETAIKKVGVHAVGPKGVYLKVGETGGRSRQFRYKFQGSGIKTIGLGSCDDVGLAAAREKAEAFRKLLANGTDPQVHRETERTAVAVAAAKAVSFDQARDEFVKKQTDWSDKYRDSWKASLETYATPILGKLPVAQVDDILVQKVLDTVESMSETMHRLRERLEKVLSYATVKKYRMRSQPGRMARQSRARL